MAESRRNEGLTADELKRKMYTHLQSAGVLDDVRGYLRQSVINELRGRYDRRGTAPDDSGSELYISSLRKNENPSWEQKAIDNLVYRHLKQSRYLYSLSIFAQESGIDGYAESLTEEMLQRLGASPDLLGKEKRGKENDCSFEAPHSSSTPVANGNEPKLLLWKILSRISSPLNLATKLDTENALKESKQEKRQLSLAEKLQAIDDEMDGTLRQRRYGDIEQRKSVATLASATRRAEEEAEKRARDSFEQWKKVELASMRVKEQEKAREKILEKTRQLEDDFAQRRDALVARERNAIDRLSNEKNAMEKDLHHQRQNLLQELEHIQMREKSLQERERIMKEMENVKIRELDLIKAEALSDQLRSAHVKGNTRSRLDSAVSSCAESLRKSLTGKESRQLDEVLHELEARSNESEMLRRELEGLKCELKETKQNQLRRSDPSQKQHETPRDGIDQSLRLRLDNLTRQLDEWKDQNKARKEATFQEEVSRWRSEMTKLLEVRDRFEDKQRQLDDMMIRVSARVGGTPRSPGRGAQPQSGQLSSTSLRLLMDPQYDVTKEPSIRDYDPVHTNRNVRWADRMPYSVRSDLIGSKKSPKRQTDVPHSTSANTTLDLDTSNDTTSSNDLTTSGVRRDIRDKFRSLEKESEELDQMYKRYIQSNYKGTNSKPSTSHTAAPIRSPTSRPAFKEPERQPSAFTRKERSLKPSQRQSTEEPKPTPRTAKTKSTAPIGQKEHTFNESQGPLAVETLEKSAANAFEEERPKSAGSQSESLPSTPEKLKDTQEARMPQSKSQYPPETNASPSLLPIGNASNTLNTLRGDFHEEESDISSKTSARSSGTKSPVLGRRLSPTGQGSLPIPLEKDEHAPSQFSRTLPPITSHKEKPAGADVLDLFGGPSASLSAPPKVFPMKVTQMAPHDESDSSFSSEEILPLRKSSKDSFGSPPKSPFERPALLQQKREELEGGFTKSQTQAKSPDREQKSPKRDMKFNLSLEDNNGIQDILQSIDSRSARSIDGKTDPKLTDLLNQLEPVQDASSQKKTVQPDQTLVTSQTKISQPKPVLMTSQPRQDTEESSPESSFLEDIQKSDGKQGVKISREAPKEEDADYSDEFTSSASEVKTMSDFEPSSTSVPRIEDKVPGVSQDAEDKSDADVNWSNLQPDKSGELQKTKEKEFASNKEVVDNPVDVFEDSQSGHSLEAPSDGGKKAHSSDDEFW